MKKYFLYGVVILGVVGVITLAPAFIGRRSMTEQEKEILESFYGDAIHFDVIRINEGGPLMFVYPGLTLGNTISFPRHVYDISKEKYQALLIHEACHVWQYQQFGLGYIPRSLWETVTQSDTYVVHYNKNKSLYEYDVEEQCEIMAEYYVTQKEEYIPYIHAVRGSTETTSPAEIAQQDMIRVFSPHEGSVVQSPLVITGEARGTWFFEASFPIVVTDWDGRIIGEGFATAEGDWMTEEFVPFVAEVEFVVDQEAYSNRGSIILRKDNPSGLPAFDDALEIPVLFGQK